MRKKSKKYITKFFVKGIGICKFEVRDKTYSGYAYNCISSLHLFLKNTAGVLASCVWFVSQTSISTGRPGVPFTYLKKFAK